MLVEASNVEEVREHTFKIATIVELLEECKVTYQPEYEDFVWILDFQDSPIVREVEWKFKDWQKHLRDNGMVFPTKEMAYEKFHKIKPFI